MQATRTVTTVRNQHNRERSVDIAHTSQLRLQIISCRLATMQSIAPLRVRCLAYAIVASGDGSARSAVRAHTPARGTDRALGSRPWPFQLRMTIGQPANPGRMSKVAPSRRL